MSIDWSNLVSRREAWVAHNFPAQDLLNPTDSLLGMVEEVGELAHSFLKNKQGIRGTAEEHMANIKDAVGDISVYMMGVMSAYGIPSEDVYHMGFRNIEEILFRLNQSVSVLTELVTHGDTEADATWARTDMAKVLHVLGHLCTHYGWSLQDIIEETWASVETRDWIKYPGTGRPTGYGSPQELSA